MYETTELDHWGPTEWPDWSKWATLKNVDDHFWTNRSGPFHLISNRSFRNLGLNGKRPSISMAAWIQPVKGCCGCARVDGLKEDLFWFALSLLFYSTFSTRLPSLHEHVIVHQYMVVVPVLDWVENQFWFDFVLISLQFLYLSFNSKWKEKYLQIKWKLSTINFKNPPKFGFFFKEVLGHHRDVSESASYCHLGPFQTSYYCRAELNWSN